MLVVFEPIGIFNLLPTIRPRTPSSHSRITWGAPFTPVMRMLKGDCLFQHGPCCFTRCLFFYLVSRFGLCSNLADMSSPLPFPSSADDDMNGTPDRKSSQPRGSVTPIRPRQGDLSRPGTVARRALAVPSSSRASANGGIQLS